MKGNSALHIRLDLVRGHLALGEEDDAVRNLRKAMSNDPGAPALIKLLDEIEADGALAADTLDVLRREARVPGGGDAAGDVLGPPLATPTLARLLAEQGHRDQAIQVAEDVLRRNPEDERARAVRSALGDEGDRRGRQIQALEGWLARIRDRKQGDAYA